MPDRELRFFLRLPRIEFQRPFLGDGGLVPVELLPELVSFGFTIPSSTTLLEITCDSQWYTDGWQLASDVNVPEKSVSDGLLGNSPLREVSRVRCWRMMPLEGASPMSTDCALLVPLSGGLDLSFSCASASSVSHEVESLIQ